MTKLDPKYPPGEPPDDGNDDNDESLVGVAFSIVALALTLLCNS